jgi:MMPL family
MARERTVDVEDPELSERANRALTDDVREALGTDRVELSDAEAREAGSGTAKDGTLGAALWNARLAVGVTFAMAVVLGVIVALATGSWLVLVGAVLVHLAVSLGITLLSLNTATQVEKPSPGTTSVLEEEGVRDPERMFNDRVEEFAGAGEEGARTGRVVTPGDNERTARPSDDAARSSSEQQTAMTPSSTPTDAAP